MAVMSVLVSEINIMAIVVVMVLVEVMKMVMMEVVIKSLVK